MTARKAAATVLLGLLAAGCGGGDGGERSPGTTGVIPPQLPTRAPGSTAPIAADELATFSRSGGIAGLRFEVVVLQDGTFQGGTGKPGRGSLGTDSLRQLRELVGAFTAAAPQPAYGSPVPDGFIRSVTAGGMTTVVHTEEGLPPPVGQLLAFLAGLERQLPR